MWGAYNLCTNPTFLLSLLMPWSRSLVRNSNTLRRIFLCGSFRFLFHVMPLQHKHQFSFPFLLFAIINTVPVFEKATPLPPLSGPGPAADGPSPWPSCISVWRSPVQNGGSETTSCSSALRPGSPLAADSGLWSQRPASSGTPRTLWPEGHAKSSLFNYFYLFSFCLQSIF